MSASPAMTAITAGPPPRNGTWLMVVPVSRLNSSLARWMAPPFPDDEKTIDDLRQRVRKTIDYLQSIPAAQIDGSDARAISVPRRAGAITMTGESYLKTFALPNFFFHVTTTYALLRHNGVELGKADFLGALPQAAAA